MVCEGYSRTSPQNSPSTYLVVGSLFGVTGGDEGVADESGASLGAVGELAGGVITGVDGDGGAGSVDSGSVSSVDVGSGSSSEVVSAGVSSGTGEELDAGVDELGFGDDAGITGLEEEGVGDQVMYGSVVSA